jgi:hypothetical protein
MQHSFPYFGLNDSSGEGAGARPKIIYAIKFDSFYLFLILNLPMSLKIRGFSLDSGMLDNLLIVSNFRELPEFWNLLHVIFIM